MNQYLAIGNLTKKPELVKHENTTFCNFSIAVNNRDDVTSFVDVTTYGKQAFACEKYLQKGSQVCVKGIPSVRAWVDKDGQAHAVLRVKIREIDFLSFIKPNAAEPNDGAVSDNLPI
jgi:single-strand DNA-binding protein